MTDFLYYLTESTDAGALAWFDAQHKLQWPQNNVYSAVVGEQMLIIAQSWNNADMQTQPWYSASRVKTEAEYNTLYPILFPPLHEEE